MKQTDYSKVVEANIALHTRLAGEYNSCEPQFRKENLDRVEAILRSTLERAKCERMLDLGCGTGFVIDLAKHHTRHITGVDVTQAMLDRVDRTGPATIELHNHDTGSFEPEAGTYDVVTAYSFLHHLYDIRPTLRTAYKALREGGVFYADQDPNFYFWEAIGKLERHGDHHATVRREIEMTSYKDEDIEKEFGVSKDIFNQAEFSKNIKGGFTEEELRAQLLEVGFRKVEVFHYWYIGQAGMVNDPRYSKEQNLRQAELTGEMLQQIMPLSRPLFKYLGFFATK